LDKQVPGAVEPDLQIVARRRAAHLGAEQPLDLAARQANMVGDFDQRQRLGEVSLHQFDDRQDLCVLDAEACPERQALAVRRAAHPVGKHLLANPVDQIVVEIVADELQHHVERRRAAGAGEDVLVDLEQVGKHVGLRERFREARQVLPVDGAALVGQEPRRRQHMRSGTEPTDRNTAIVLLAQPRECRSVLVRFDIEAAADNHHGRPVRPGHLAALILQRGVDGAFDEVGCAHRLAVDAGETPFVSLVAQHAVRRPQRIERGGKRDHGEVGDEEEDQRSLDRMLYGVQETLTQTDHGANRMSRSAKRHQESLALSMVRASP
jgi:hypothetical protein